ncbi:MAG: T9SS type A sorting domain-containing protein [Bacteroidetes bacterium]|nr:MAG: T9SS type A sorting domain-containing protein [Bacteroidota bacterium]
MHVDLRFSLLFSLFLSGFQLAGQSVLLEEDFNACTLPAHWQVYLNGNPNMKWYVGLSQNNNAPGESIDGTCMLFMDDDATGNNTQGYIMKVLSPKFDPTQFETVALTMDVHYRHRQNSRQTLDILITDGTTEQLLTRFDSTKTNGANISDHFALNFDLTLFSLSPTTQLVIRYNDIKGDLGWWAAFDNIRVTGSNTNTNLLSETFNACTKPAGWETAILSGQNDWKFGQLPPSSAAYNHGSSMDGSCFVYFDDDDLGAGAPPSSIRLTSPWFNGVDFFTYTLSYDLILRYTGESIAVFVEDDQGSKTELFRSTGHVGGPWFPDFVHQTHDLTPFRSQQLRIIFEYTDNGVFGYWVGLDNIKVTGNGAAFDFCNQAHTLQTGDTCITENNLTALFNGPSASCTSRTAGSLWYTWQADFTGVATLRTNADFNDLVNIYTGSCANLQPVLCHNRDEHGFTGEQVFFQVQSGTMYYIRVAGQEDGFGVPRGTLCMEIGQAGGFPVKPSNDDCTGAETLTVNGPCLSGNNYNADMSAVQPSLNDLARADIWYKFTAGALPAGDFFEIQSNANFSEIITVYSGTCAALTELAGNHKGSTLALPDLTDGSTYFIQIAGNFASVEGGLCPRVVTKQGSAIPNDDCLDAVEVALGSACVSGINASAGFSGYQPGCAVFADRDIWFKFIAPAFGSVRINTGANFPHTMAVWEGDCNDLQPVFCALNPLRCDGFVSVPSLVPGQTYYVQLATWIGPGGGGSGTVCLKILDGQGPPDFRPLEMELLQPCVGIDSAQLKIKINGGVPPYIFLADSHNQIVSSGTPIFIIVRDAIGCETTLLDTTQACASNSCDATVVIDAQPPSCFGDTNGSIQANVSGAGGSLSFKWSNNIFTSTNANLGAGTYTVTISEPSGCEYIYTETLTQPTPIQITLDSIRHPLSGFSNGLIQTTVTGGAGVYEYDWYRDGTPLSANGEDLANLPAGVYKLVVTDSSGCTQEQTFSLIPIDCSAEVSLVLSQPSCFGSTDGSIQVNVENVSGSITFLWSNNAATEIIENLAAGIYMVTVTEPSGCTYEESSMLPQPDSILVTTAVVMQPVTGQNNGFIDIDVTGGHGGYSFAWYRNDTLLATTQEDITDLFAGLYTLIVTDSTGCSGTYTYDLTSVDCTASLSLAPDNPTCFGSTDGSVLAEVNGASGAVDFQWSNNFSGALNTGLSAGQYTVTATETSGCTYSLSIQLEQPDAILVMTDSVRQPLIGAHTGYLHISVAGGNGGYSYSWSRNDTLLNINLEDLDSIPAGTYTLLVTDSSGCLGVYTYSLLAIGCTADVSITVDPPSCHGDSDGAILASVAGANGSVTFQWSNDVSGPSNTGLEAGTYTVTITDTTGCEYVISQAISEPGLIEITTEDIQQPFIGQANGSIHIAVTGGNGGYSYSWFRNDTLLMADIQDLDSIPSGFYSLIVTDSAGCTGTYTFDLMGIVSTSVPDMEMGLRLYPNPTFGKTTLELRLSSPQEVILSVTDVYGRIIEQWSFNAGTQHTRDLDLTAFPPGVYLIAARTGGLRAYQPLVIAR